MFKLESYVTPVLLSYVDKYIKNFRPEDSQVSLWGGDASFHNLDLRLDVLEEELQLPFSLVSGHIHELLIHVPWTKIASEPINITINTIECVLKLRGPEAASFVDTKKKQSHNKKQEIATAPGYVQNLVNKIVSNITINCNNLILKYVEEDIVVSVNIKSLILQSANDAWQAAYIEVTPQQMTIRKLITLLDLTVCLDKRNAAGKIEVYQEPVLYRCCIEIRFLRDTLNTSSNTRIDFYSNRMEFSMTEQQVPMLMRMINLLIALHQKQLRSETTSEMSQTTLGVDVDEGNTERKTWTGWVWNFASTVFPPDDDLSSEWGRGSSHQQTYLGSTLQIGFYVDHTILTFKVSEYYSGERTASYYPSTRKLKHWPYLCLQLNGCYVDTVLGGAEWCSVQMGIAEAFLIPQGNCSCGLQELTIKEPFYYLKTGTFNGKHLTNSLFDRKREENDSQRKTFSVSWEYYLCTITEDVLLEKTPAFAIDYLYNLELPEDFTSDKLSDLGSDLEYSNLSEKAICRIISGPLVVHVCSGLIHRLSTLEQMMRTYDYAPYKEDTPTPDLNELHPPSEDDFDALNQSISMRIYQVTLLKPMFEFHLMDHPKFVPFKGNLFRRSKKSNTTKPSSFTMLNCPSVSLECETIDTKIVMPMYPKRLVYTTCQLPEPPEQMFDACYKRINCQITGLSSHMIFNQHKRTTILLPFNIQCAFKSIIFPKYWIQPDVPHDEIQAQIESITLSSTKAKLMLVLSIIDKLSLMDSGDFRNSVFVTSLIEDASRDAGMVVLELYAEQLKLKHISTIHTMSYNFNISLLKVFVIEPRLDLENSQTKEPDQVLIISGPENEISNNSLRSDDTTLLSVTIQYRKNAVNTEESHPILLFFNFAELQMCIDPLLFHWLLYRPKKMRVKYSDVWNTDKLELINIRNRNMSDMNMSSSVSAQQQDTPHRANTPHESVHSSSERDRLPSISSTTPLNQSNNPPQTSQGIVGGPYLHHTTSTSERVTSASEDENYPSTFATNFPTAASNNNNNSYDLFELVLRWYPTCMKAIIIGDLAHCMIYLPTKSLSAVGSRGIGDAINNSLNGDNPPELVVIHVPEVTVRSATQQKNTQHLFHRMEHLPVKLPNHIWVPNKSSFPWTISIGNCSCYTIQNGCKYNFFKPVSGNITIGFTVNNLLDEPVKNTTTTTSETTAASRSVPKKSNKKLTIEKALQQTIDLPTNNIKSFSVCVYIDNTPIEIVFSAIQVHLLSDIMNAFYEVMGKFSADSYQETTNLWCNEEPILELRNNDGRSRTQSPPTTYFNKEEELFNYDFCSEKTPTSLQTDGKNNEDDSNEMKFTVWIQWTLPRLRLKLYSNELEEMRRLQSNYLEKPPLLKLVFDIEDVMLSQDVQQVYTKFKCKIVTASIHHYQRKTVDDVWEQGIYLGTVLRAREDLASNEKQDDFGFMSITYTKAKCGHVHNKWGASKKHRLAEMKIDQEQQGDFNSNTTRYISEIVATLQPIDLIISPKILKNFYTVIEPFVSLNNIAPVNEKPIQMNCLNNHNFPLAYLDCNGLRIVFLSSKLIENLAVHDVCVLDIESIQLVPTAENPICRVPLRPEIYQHAAQTRILHVPGSEIEDRQYQLDINGLSVNTGSWSEFSQVLSRTRIRDLNLLHTMNENPALEWNHLGGPGPSFSPHLQLLPIIKKFNQCLVIAPAIIYRNQILICGCSLEINCISDIEINISLQQFRLISSLLTECVDFYEPVIDIDNQMQKRSKCSYLNIDEQQYFNDDKIEIDTINLTEEMIVQVPECARDSGVEITDMNSEFTVKTKDSTQLSSITTEVNKRDLLKLHHISYDSKNSDISQSYSKCCYFIPCHQQSAQYCPVEMLITGGKITISLYKITNRKIFDREKFASQSNRNEDDKTLPSTSKDDAGYDASEEDEEENIINTKSRRSSIQKIQPLLFLSFSQPNLFISQVAFEKKINWSCFDICLKANESQYCYTDRVPTEKDFKIHLIETKSGIPDSETGIPPAFITLRMRTSQKGQASILDIDFGRPIKIFYSLLHLNHLLYIKDRIIENFSTPCSDLVLNKKLTTTVDTKYVNKYTQQKQVQDSYTKFKNMKNMFNGINKFNLTLSQVVFVLKCTTGPEMIFSFGKLESYLAFSIRPERISDTIVLKNFTISTKVNDATKLLLNPWSFTLTTSLLWEAWQLIDSDPQIQTTVDSDRLLLDFGPEQLKCIEAVKLECEHLQNMFQKQCSTPNDLNKKVSSSYEEENTTTQTASSTNIEECRDQYYKDDLRAGAFQFVDASSTDELPLPYQVMFWNQGIAAMAWRYPQPRLLAKVRVFPVPFKLNTQTTLPASDNDQQKPHCSLEYWSECHSCFKPYAQFYLSESEMCHLDLPTNLPQPGVSCTWRVVLSYAQSDCLCVLPRALAACLRIDSYFNPQLVPTLQLAVNFSSINICFYNQFNRNLALVMPDKLRGFTPDGLIPDNQCFLVAEAEPFRIFFASWIPKIKYIDLNASLKCSTLDYSTLTLENLIEPFSLAMTLNVNESVQLSAISESVHLRISPSMGHTLAISSQIWTQHWLTNNDNKEPPDMIVITRYIVCNNTNVKLRFGQHGTEEDILLPPKFLHLYCWRTRKQRRQIRVGTEQNNWLWSKPLTIDRDTTQLFYLETKSNSKSFTLIMTVKSLSSTQKHITFSGQLFLCNMLMDHFELKVVPHLENSKSADVNNAQNYLIGGHSVGQSLIINMKKKLTLRLKFLNLESAWSGDIPLEENTKCAQPWLVKIPLQERGQFLSIWCRVLVQKNTCTPKIIVMLWPLFMIRSNLPFSTKGHVETESLNVRIETNILGKGELQQLYCPGTIDHSHNLKFHLGAENNSSDPHVPLNYSLIDHREIFKRLEKEDFNTIIDCLNNYNKAKWPYVDSTVNPSDWNIDSQPVTHVQVRYESACQYSSSLLVELLPWCLILNTVGLPLAILTNGRQVCSVNHQGIVTPPKLDDTFNIAVTLDENLWFISPLLQLARPDWSQSFYMPRIKGIIPLHGNISIPIKCDKQLCMICITSTVLNEMRILQISSTHIITNHTKFPLEVACIALPDNNKIYNNNIPENRIKSILLEPYIGQSNIGVPLTQWYLDEDITEPFSDYTLHIIISLANQSAVQSCPIRVDKQLFRKNICLYSETDNIPLVLISQEQKGENYLSLHHDIHPQLLIKNNSETNLYCAQCNTDGAPIQENNCIAWTCLVQANTSTYYSMPNVSEHFPNIDDNNTQMEKLILAIQSQDDSETTESNHSIYQWTQPININIYNEQYVRIPQYGDVKLSVQQISHTILITIDSVTEVEISAQDIRSRLLLQSAVHSEPNLSVNLTSPSNNESIIPIMKTKPEVLERNESETTVNSSIFHSATTLTTDTYKSNTDQSIQYGGVLKQWRTSSNYQAINTNLNEFNFNARLQKNPWHLFSAAVIVRNIIITLANDFSDCNTDEIRFTGPVDLSTLTFDLVTFTMDKNDETADCSISISDIQCDNQLFHGGSYDFPVVLIGEHSSSSAADSSDSNIHFQTNHNHQLIDKIKTKSVILIDLTIGIWQDEITNKQIIDLQDVKVKLDSILAYIEDTYITKLVDYLYILSPTQLVLTSSSKTTTTSLNNSTASIMSMTMTVIIPEHLSWESTVIARPLRLRSLQIEPVSILLSVHSSLKLYIALDRSPLSFTKFERKRLLTTPFRLGHALTMHYLSGAIFGAGWVVGSLELLGSPSGLARTLGTGLRDFIRLPYRGLVHGPWAFLIGITHGSASLMRHLTAGTLDSVTKLAASVARNLDRLTLDEEHQRRTDELRRQRPQGVTQGFLQGLTGLGISLLGAVGGIAHHPLQSVLNDGASPRGLAAGVATGLVGVITKPLSGAAELVALTGQGLLRGAGWNPLPVPRRLSTSSNNSIINESHLHSTSQLNAILHYKWKLLHHVMNASSSHSSNHFIAIVDAVYNSSIVQLAVTFDALIVIDIDEDAVQRIIPFSEISGAECSADATMLYITLVSHHSPATKPGVELNNDDLEPEKDERKIDVEDQQLMLHREIEMDPISRARVADYVRNTSSSLMQNRDDKESSASTNSDQQDDAYSSHYEKITHVKFTMDQPCIAFHIHPTNRKYFCDILTLIKQQNQNSIFKIF